MKKFVQVKGELPIHDYGDQWFWLIESIDDIDQEFESQLNNRIVTAVTQDWRRPDWIERVHAVNTNQSSFADKFKKYNQAMLVREVGSFMFLGKLEITKLIHSNVFPNDNNSDIVICENDIKAEEPWIEFLESRFPDQSIKLLNLFSTRSAAELDRDLDVKYITFYTTFTSTEWFENILDTIIRNNWTDKEIIGHSIGCGFTSLPTHVKEKIKMIESMGNKVTKVKHL